METAITVNRVEKYFTTRVSELLVEPEYQADANSSDYAMDTRGIPIVKVAVGNVPLDYDLWKGMRNPAGIGSYPVGLPEFWEFYANRRKRTFDESGRRSVFQIPQSFESAKNDFERVVVISIMMPFSKHLISQYANPILKKEKTRTYSFKKTYNKVNQIINTAISRTAIDLMTPDNVVIPLDNDTVMAITEETIPASRQGTSHGPCKGGNVPQKSLAVLMGLGQIGVSRMVFRDEMINGAVERFAGPMRSIIIFDKSPLVKNGQGGIVLPTPAWREFLFRLTDYTDTDPEINKYRYCAYIPAGDKGCVQCIRFCPSGAQPSSTPNKTGGFSKKVSRQSHRFYQGKLQFDFVRCSEETGQMASIFPEWSCARCLTVCASSGVRRVFSAENYTPKMKSLTT